MTGGLLTSIKITMAIAYAIKPSPANEPCQPICVNALTATIGPMVIASPADESRTLRKLEQTLSAQLFLRGNEGITLTEAGEAFSRRAEWILEELQRAILCDCPA